MRVISSDPIGVKNLLRRKIGINPFEGFIPKFSKRSMFEFSLVSVMICFLLESVGWVNFLFPPWFRFLIVVCSPINGLNEFIQCFYYIFLFSGKGENFTAGLISNVLFSFTSRRDSPGVSQSTLFSIIVSVLKISIDSGLDSIISEGQNGSFCINESFSDLLNKLLMVVISLGWVDFLLEFDDGSLCFEGVILMAFNKKAETMDQVNLYFLIWENLKFLSEKCMKPKIRKNDFLIKMLLNVLYKVDFCCPYTKELRYSDKVACSQVLEGKRFPTVVNSRPLNNKGFTSFQKGPNEWILRRGEKEISIKSDKYIKLLYCLDNEVNFVKKVGTFKFGQLVHCLEFKDYLSFLEGEFEIYEQNDSENPFVLGAWSINAPARKNAINPLFYLHQFKFFGKIYSNLEETIKTSPLILKREVGNSKFKRYISDLCQIPELGFKFKIKECIKNTKSKSLLEAIEMEKSLVEGRVRSKVSIYNTETGEEFHETNLTTFKMNDRSLKKILETELILSEQETDPNSDRSKKKKEDLNCNLYSFYESEEVEFTSGEGRQRETISLFLKEPELSNSPVPKGYPPPLMKEERKIRRFKRTKFYRLTRNEKNSFLNGVRKGILNIDREIGANKRQNYDLGLTDYKSAMNHDEFFGVKKARVIKSKKLNYCSYYPQGLESLELVEIRVKKVSSRLVEEFPSEKDVIRKTEDFILRTIGQNKIKSKVFNLREGEKREDVCKLTREIAMRTKDLEGFDWKKLTPGPKTEGQEFKGSPDSVTVIGLENYSSIKSMVEVLKSKKVENLTDDDVPANFHELVKRVGEKESEVIKNFNKLKGKSKRGKHKRMKGNKVRSGILSNKNKLEGAIVVLVSIFTKNRKNLYNQKGKCGREMVYDRIRRKSWNTLMYSVESVISNFKDPRREMMIKGYMLYFKQVYNYFCENSLKI